MSYPDPYGNGYCCEYCGVDVKYEAISCWRCVFIYRLKLPRRLSKLIEYILWR